MGTLTEDEKSMRLQGYVRVTNRSGEDYENAQTRLIVGKVNLIDRIADLARRQQPYGSPIQPIMLTRKFSNRRRSEAKAQFLVAASDSSYAWKDDKEKKAG